MQNLKDIPFFQGLSEAELSEIRLCLKERTFEKGETLFMEGSACEKVFFVKSGRVKLSRTSSGGREQILETLSSGDACACNPGSSAWRCASTAIAATRCTAWFLSRENYGKLVHSNAKLSQALNRLFAERLRCFSALIEEISLKDSKKRLVKFILDMHAENDGKDVLVLDFTREELAQRIGTARETIGRQLYQLKAKKLIDIKPRQIVIRDKAGLEKLL
jgi:CRP/FNR family transcriptional regulator